MDSGLVIAIVLLALIQFIVIMCIVQIRGTVNCILGTLRQIVELLQEDKKE